MFAVKRACDIAAAICIGLIALPIIIVTASLVRFTSPGPIFYGHQRIGRHGRRFMAWKFRTMFPNAAAKLKDYLAERPDLAAEWRASTSCSMTLALPRLAAGCAEPALDELPQIWNVLVGI